MSDVVLGDCLVSAPANAAQFPHMASAEARASLFVADVYKLKHIFPIQQRAI